MKVSDDNSRRLLEIENALLESEDRFFSAFENAPIGMGLISPSGALLKVNRAYCEMLGYSKEELLKKTVADITFPEDIEYSLDYYHRMIAGESLDGHMQKRYSSSSGSLIQAQLSISLVRNSTGDPLYFIVQVEDVTERKHTENELRNYQDHLELLVAKRTAALSAVNAELTAVNSQMAALNKTLKHKTQELEETNQELEAFSYSVSHDLRAPVRSIASFSGILAQEYAGAFDSTGLDYLNRVINNASKMNQLIDDLLEFSRVSRAAKLLTTVNLSNIVQETADELIAANPQREIELRIKPEVTVQGDKSLLKILVTNLLNNAWKFTSKNKVASIEFNSIRQKGQTVFYIRDNGVGFDMAYVKKLFIPFQRLHTTKEFPGTGIGLAIVARIARRHGGKVWAEGTVDQGATIFFTLGERSG